jgi:hypothetical protein
LLSEGGMVARAGGFGRYDLTITTALTGIRSRATHRTIFCTGQPQDIGSTVQKTAAPEARAPLDRSQVLNAGIVNCRLRMIYPLVVLVVVTRKFNLCAIGAVSGGWRKLEGRLPPGPVTV